MKVGILGTGAYAIGLATVLDDNENDIIMWTKFQEERDIILNNRINYNVLDGITISDNIKITSSLKETVEGKDLLVISVPITFLEDTVIAASKFYKGSHICIATKGIEEKSCLCANEIVEKYFDTDKVAIISGPTFAIDLANKTACALTLATNNNETSECIQKALINDNLKLELSNDIIGVSLCGGIKNVMAIGSGIIEGLGQSDSTRALFLKDALFEMSNLIHSLGGKRETVFTYAGIGDLLLTCSSNKSRNFAYGQKLGSNSSDLKEYKNETTIEGLRTLNSIYKIIKHKNITSEIIETIYNICENKMMAKELINMLIRKN